MEMIQDYKILEKIAETRGSTVYRCRKENEKNTVIIKTLIMRYPAPSEIARFKQEYEIIKNIDLDGVIKTYDIISHDGGFAILLEDFNGVSIKSILDSGKKFDIKSFLKMAVKISETLGELHKRDIIHKDIKPHNILINRNDGRVKITDFGISSILTRENDEIYNSDVIQGTLLYISPEQTGRMNRTVDYRTDLYSLGVTLYEILTGVVPFESRDPIEVIHSHIARRPLPPIERRTDIPEVISDIVMKLLSKNAEDRYQNSFGLMSDLSECIKKLEANNRIEPFVLARHDISNRFVIPQKLFGREKEIEILLSAFDRVSTIPQNGREKGGDLEIMLVSGAPGIGKSFLINEIQRPITAKRGYFISGKYEQFRKDKPYSAIIQAFQGLTKQIIAESEENIQLWKKSILEALGNNGKIIIDMIPAIELIIGPQSDVPKLGAKEEKNRFNIVFEGFVGVFTKREHPITLFLDDLQWADLASLQLIRNLAANQNIRYLFLIGSYRDNEVPESHPLIETLNGIEKIGIAINRITLSELSVNDIKDLIVNFLRCSEERGLSLAELVYKKTNGNPFFVTEFMHSLYNDRLIEIDASLGWKWDMEKISRMRVTANVVEFMADKINKLPEEVKDILKICACIGNRFDLETLSVILNKQIGGVLDILTKAMNEGFIGISGSGYVFHHDRIQEAAYSLIPDEEKPGVHYKIGRLMLENTDEKELPNKLFYITDQLNLGYKLISDSKERKNLAKMNLECGKKAAASTAYTPALGYLEMGMSLLEAESWDKQYDLTLALYTETIGVACLKGNYDRMNSLSETAFQRTKTILDKVNIYKAKISACIAREDLEGAITYGLNFYQLLGNVVKGTNFELIRRLLWFKIIFAGKSDEDILNLPDMTDPVELSSMEIGFQLSYVGYSGEPKMLASGAIKSVNQSMKYGLSPQHCLIFCGLGLVLIAGLGDLDGGYRFGNLAMKMAEKQSARRLRAATIFTYNTQIRHWKEHLKNTIEPYIEGYQIGLESGDLLYAGNCLCVHDAHNFAIGKELSELEREIAKNCNTIKNINQMQMLSQNSITWQVVLNLLGKSDNPVKLIGSAFDERKSIPQWIATNNFIQLVVFYSSRLFLDILFHDYSQAALDSEQTAKYIESIAAANIVRKHVFLDSLARLAVYPDASKKEKRMHLKKIKHNLKKFKIWAKHAPMNNLHLYNLIQAELARVLGKNLFAEKYYDLAIQLSNKYEYIQDESIANELAARYYLSINKERLARSYLTDAYQCCSRWGAIAKLTQMKQMYSELLPSTGRHSDSLADSTTLTVTGTTSQSIDLSTVIKASQTISGEVMLGKLLSKMMRIVIANAGAQKGFIILEDRGRLLVEAEGSIEKEEVRVLKSIPVEAYEELSPSIVNYVARTKEILILNNASSEGNFTKDPYVVKNNPKSILCAPIINQGRLTGILYLENNLSTGVFTLERVEVLNILSSQIAISTDNARLYENLEEKVRQRTEELRTARDALWGEMALAKKIQTVLLPDRPVIKGYEITGYMMPAAEVGGDYYDIINVGGKDWVVIGDVSGHGVPAGLIMMMVQTSIHTVLKTNPGYSPSDLLIIINDVIYENMKKLGEDKYMTITVFACLDDGIFHYSGQHQDIMIYRAAGGSVESRETCGMWIGVFDNISHTLQVDNFKLNSGDVLLLYTDGITEAFDKEHKIFSSQRLKSVLNNLGGNTTEEIKDGILNELREYDCRDDVTMVVIKRI